MASMYPSVGNKLHEEEWENDAEAEVERRCLVGSVLKPGAEANLG